jgi:hypothetical protein
MALAAEAVPRPTARWHSTCETEHDAADIRFSPAHRTSDHITRLACHSNVTAATGLIAVVIANPIV